MIAGFVEIDHEERQRYQTMKQLLFNTAQPILDEKKDGGMLTSRPKQLIHITLGRVLWIDELLTTTKSCSVSCGLLQDDVRKLVKEYNQIRLPKVVCKFKEPKSIKLTEISFLRNQIWLCVQNTIYQTWHYGTNT
jgi:hypothetical protein